MTKSYDEGKAATTKRWRYKRGRTCDAIDSQGRVCGAPIVDSNATGRCKHHPLVAHRRASQRPPASAPVLSDDPAAKRYEL